MNNILPVLSGLTAGIFDSFLKFIVKKKYSSSAYLFLIYLISTIITLPFFVFSPKIPSNLKSWFLYILTIIFYAEANFMFVSAYKFEDVSNIAIVSKTSFVFTFILGIFLFKEKVNILSLTGAAMILIGIIITFLKVKKLKFYNVRGLLYGSVGGLGYALGAATSKYLLGFIPPLTYVFLIYVGFVITFSFYPKTFREAISIFNESKFPIFLLSLVGILSYSIYLISLKSNILSFTFIVNASVGLLISVGIGIILLKEKENMLNKLLGLVTVTIGIVLFYVK